MRFCGAGSEDGGISFVLAREWHPNRVCVSLERGIHRLELVGEEQQLLISQLGVWDHGELVDVLLKFGGPAIRGAQQHRERETNI